MWLQMEEDEGALLVYLQQVKHMWVGFADRRNGALEEGAEREERRARVQVLRAKPVEPKQALLWRLIQQDAQVAEL